MCDDDDDDDDVIFVSSFRPSLAHAVADLDGKLTVASDSVKLYDAQLLVAPSLSVVADNL